MADADRNAAVAAWRNLFGIFEAALRLLHPFMPFLTEELWHRLPQHAPDKDQSARSIALQPFPRPAPQWSDPGAEQEVKLLQDVIVAARNVRAELKLDPKRRVPADLAPAKLEVREVVEENRAFVLRLATLSDLRFSGAKLEPNSGPVRSTPQFDLRIAYGDTVELGAELARLRKEKERLARDLESKQNRLADETFRSRAPAEIVRQLEATFAERKSEFDKLTERLAQLERSGDSSPTA
jgi:valyl-tRNA synthetase